MYFILLHTKYFIKSHIPGNYTSIIKNTSSLKEVEEYGCSLHSTYNAFFYIYSMFKGCCRCLINH